MKIAIVGHGFVGKAVHYGFTHINNEFFIVDPIYGTSIEDVPTDVDVVFVCVPTPMRDDKKIDSSILEDCMEKLIQRLDDNALIVIKSTITPDIASSFSNYRVVYNPEFLTERSALSDFIRPEFHIFGGSKENIDVLRNVYENFSLCEPCEVFEMTLEEASLSKYAINSYLAMKVTFFNQLYDVAEDMGANFSKVVKAVSKDSRIGPSHTRVPGFDGKRGFGGACFPKDTSALVNFTDKMTLIESVISINNLYRSAQELDEREKIQNVKYY
jgi:UDPglucose 6-dehydrogenase